MTVYILIPAYNEEERLAAVLTDLRVHGWHNILVVDDGSTDATSQVAQKHQAHLMRLKKNRGQGYALQTGFDYLRRTANPDVVVTFDADRQHKAADIRKLVQALNESGANIALGSRFLKPISSIPPVRRFLLRLGVIYTRWTTGLDITDTHNGLRALTRTAYQNIAITWPRRAHASQILTQIARLHLRYVEVPVTILYPAQRALPES